MGTRADFYLGSGEQARWLGSIAWDGYPSGIDDAILVATTEERYESAVREFFAERDDVSGPDRGWPWPWDDSHATDYAYCFVDGKVEAYVFGSGPFDPTADEAYDRDDLGKGSFPDMSKAKNVAWGSRSGVIVIGA